MELKRPKELTKIKTWFPESGTVECDCGKILTIRSTIKGHDAIKCDCDIMYEFWNNSDGTGLRFNVKGYFPFYPTGYEFSINRGPRK